jgi:predicted Rossmann-fold nucleotide-binding protein
MAAVSKSFYDTPNRRGLVIGVLPCGESLENPRDGYPNQWVEIPVATHLPLSGEGGTEPMSRNHVNVLSSDVMVALPGGAGTLSEVRLAVRYERPVVAFVESDQDIPGLPDSVPTCSSLEGVRTFVTTQLGLSGLRPKL